MMGTLTSLLFLGGTGAPFGWLSWIPGSIWLSLKIAAVVFLFIWVR
jgi:NADH-quinone oxidoreductase subunit H